MLKAKKELDSHVPNSPYFWEGKNTELASCFFPHIFECRKKGKMSSLEFFNNDECLRSAIEKVICLYGKTSDAKIRQLCRNHHLSSRINNFPPRVAKAILSELSNGRDVEVLDPCCGFGGRLLGSMSCLNVKKYVGIDLSLPTYEGNKKMIDMLGFSQYAAVYHGDCLKLMDGMGIFDIILTSPPFLDTEEYIGVPSEANYDKWKTSFIEPLLKLSKKCLKENGKAAFYLENISGNSFVEDFCDIAISSGFNVEKSIKFKAPHNEYNRSSNKQMRELKISVFSCKK
jgi:tRNA1(Val) A37 N6-methylase TrmN6